MNKYLKLSIYFMIVALLIQIVPIQSFANDNADLPETLDTEVILFSADEDGLIELFEDENAEKLLASIPDATSVELLDQRDDYSLISYTDVDDEDSAIEEVIWTGYVRSVHVINTSDTDDFMEQRKNEDFVIEDYVNDSPIEDEDRDSIESDSAVEPTESTEPIEPSNDEPKEKNPDENPIEIEPSKETPSPSTFSSASTQSTALQGVALKSSTNVYSQTSQSSKSLKSYKQGHILKFQSHNANWYMATVFISGKAQTGYIHQNDVDLINGPQRIQGFGLVQPVNVYGSPTQSSKVLKSYNKGSSLIYQSFSSQWHKATVYVNGKAHTGYIRASDVGPKAPAISPPVKGIAIANTVSVYGSTSKSSTKLKSYKKGHILIYRAFNNNWYEATVYVNGKARSGYIHSDDVENSVTSQSTLQGLGSKNPTRVYSSASTSSKSLKNYKQGHILKYRTFTTNWYEATVIIKGKAQTGYIHKNDVEAITKQKKTIRGFGAKSPTRVYASASKSSATLKSYRISAPMTYRTFTADWYEATVYVNGKARTGYIHKNDVRLTPGKVVVLDPGHGGIDPGASALGIVEKRLNLDIALRTRKLLENAGYTVIMTRSTDIFIPLAGRAKIANDSNADIFISIHGNSMNGSISGIETFWYGKFERANSIRLANSLQTNLVNSMNIRHRRVAEGNFHVIRETKMPSALVEVGFIDNPGDAAKLKQAKYKQLAAQGILNGVQNYFK